MDTISDKTKKLTQLILARLGKSTAATRSMDLIVDLIELSESLGYKWKLNDSKYLGLMLTSAGPYRLQVRRERDLNNCNLNFLVDKGRLENTARTLGTHRAEKILSRIQLRTPSKARSRQGSKFRLVLPAEEFSAWDGEMFATVTDGIRKTFPINRDTRKSGGPADGNYFQMADIQAARQLVYDSVDQNPTREIFPDEIAIPFAQLREGAAKQVFVNAYERNPQARQACIRIHGLACKVCRMDFESRYGELGKGFIHVHHKAPLGKAMGERAIDPEKDLVPVCPNCHAMLHAKDPPLSVDELIPIVQRHTAR